jgi:hypothetical protein
VTCLGLLGGALFGGTAVAKKKKGGGTVTATAGAAVVPPAVIGPPDRFGVAAIPLTVGKKAKGKVVSYEGVRVTYQLTAGSNLFLNDIFMRLTAPNGRTVFVEKPQVPVGITTVGPLTLTPNSSVQMCPALPITACADPDDTLAAPFAGTAQSSGLEYFRGLPAKGTWTLKVLMFDDQGPVTVNSVKLEVPVVSKPKDDKKDNKKKD